PGNRLGGTELIDQSRGQTLHSTNRPTPSRNEYFRNESILTLRQRRSQIDQCRCLRTESVNLFLVPDGTGETDGFDFGSFCSARFTDIRGFPIGLFFPRLGVIRLDIDTDLGTSELSLHVGSPFRLLHGDPGLLGLFLLAVRLDLLVCNLTLGEDV